MPFQSPARLEDRSFQPRRAITSQPNPHTRGRGQGDLQGWGAGPRVVAGPEAGALGEQRAEGE